MDYLKANVDNFSIAEYFRHINAQFRETAEKDFKKLIGKVSNFESNKKNLPLLQLASRLRRTKFEILISEEADEYWSSVLTSATVRKRIHVHLTSEASIADAILDNAKKRLKSKVVAAEVKLKHIK